MRTYLGSASSYPPSVWGASDPLGRHHRHTILIHVGNTEWGHLNGVNNLAV